MWRSHKIIPLRPPKPKKPNQAFAKNRFPLPKMNRFNPTRIRGLTYRGWEILGVGQKRQVIGGPGEPPEGFVGGTTSRSEWYLYWAFTLILGPEGERWSYQESFLGGRHVPGGAVVDFTLRMTLKTVGVRLQTYRFHFAFGSEKHQYDIEQLIALSENMVVVDVYEQDFIFDETGSAAIMVAKDCIAGIQRPNPLSIGLVLDVG